MRWGKRGKRGKRTRIKKIAKTYGSRDSHVVTHRSTSLPIHGLNMTERTGCLVFRDQWSYV
ncbi:hypothetical protein K402DRAFT_360133, partial [Aulographum hederae CBS 113979]